MMSDFRAPVWKSRICLTSGAGSLGQNCALIRPRIGEQTTRINRPGDVGSGRARRRAYIRRGFVVTRYADRTADGGKGIEPAPLADRQNDQAQDQADEDESAHNDAGPDTP